MTEAREENQSGSSATTRGPLSAISLRCGELTWRVMHKLGRSSDLATLMTDEMADSLKEWLAKFCKKKKKKISTRLCTWSCRKIEACFQFWFVAVSTGRSRWISRSVREILLPATVRLREGHTALLEWKSISASLHVNSMHLFGDAELEQGLRPQAEVGALAVWKSLGKALLNYSISRRWKSVTFRYGPGPLIRCAASTIFLLWKR